MPRTDVLDAADRIAAEHRRKRAALGLSARLEQSAAAAKAAHLRPALSNTLYRGVEATDPKPEPTP